MGRYILTVAFALSVVLTGSAKVTNISDVNAARNLFGSDGIRRASSPLVLLIYDDSAAGKEYKLAAEKAGNKYAEVQIYTVPAELCDSLSESEFLLKFSISETPRFYFVYSDRISSMNSYDFSFYWPMIYIYTPSSPGFQISDVESAVKSLSVFIKALALDWQGQYKKALDLFLKAFSDSHWQTPRAAYHIGSIYAYHYDKLDKKYYNHRSHYEYMAYYYFRKGGYEYGDPEAFYQLGICYEIERGVERDLPTAYECYRIAGKIGHKEALDSANRLEYELGY